MRYFLSSTLIFAAIALFLYSAIRVFAETPSNISDAGSVAIYDIGPRYSDTFTIGAKTFLISTSKGDGGLGNEGISTYDISDIDDITFVDQVNDTCGLCGYDQGYDFISNPAAIEAFTIGSDTYAVHIGGEGIQLIAIDADGDMTSKGGVADSGDYITLQGYGGRPSDLSTFVIGSNTYVIITGGYGSNKVQIVDLSDVGSGSEDSPSITAKAIIEHDATFTELLVPSGVDTFSIGSNTYAIVTGHDDNGVQLLDISDVDNIAARGIAEDGATFTTLDGPMGVDTFSIGASTYAIVTANDDDGVQILDLSDVANSNVSAKGVAVDGETFTELEGAEDVSTFTIGTFTYAMVASFEDDGVQILDISDVDNIAAKDAETHGVNGFELSEAIDTDIVTIDNILYGVITSGYRSPRAQFIKLNDDITSPTVTITSSSGSSGSSTGSTTLSFTATFSESVSNFVVGDITVTGSANGGSPAASNFAGSGTTYTFDVVKGSSSGTVSVTIAAGAATDAVGNANTVSNTYILTIIDATNTPTNTPTNTATNTATATPTLTTVSEDYTEPPPTVTITSTATITTSPTLTRTPSITPTYTVTFTPTYTLTFTPTFTPTAA